MTIKLKNLEISKIHLYYKHLSGISFISYAQILNTGKLKITIKLKNLEISKIHLYYNTFIWNKLHQLRSNSKYWKSQK